MSLEIEVTKDLFTAHRHPVVNPRDTQLPYNLPSPAMGLCHFNSSPLFLLHAFSTPRLSLSPPQPHEFPDYSFKENLEILMPVTLKMPTDLPPEDPLS